MRGYFLSLSLILIQSLFFHFLFFSFSEIYFYLFNSVKITSIVIYFMGLRPINFNGFTSLPYTYLKWYGERSRKANFLRCNMRKQIWVLSEKIACSTARKRASNKQASNKGGMRASNRASEPEGRSGKNHPGCAPGCCCRDALIIDTDKQKSAAGWWRERDGELPELVTASSQSVPKALEATKRQWVFIDTPPRHEEALRAVCAVSDFILIPARPGILDLRAIADTVGLVDKQGCCDRPQLLSARTGGLVRRVSLLRQGGSLCLRAAGLPRGYLAAGCLLACFEWGIGCYRV